MQKGDIIPGKLNSTNKFSPYFPKIEFSKGIYVSLNGSEKLAFQYFMKKYS